MTDEIKEDIEYKVYPIVKAPANIQFILYADGVPCGQLVVRPWIYEDLVKKLKAVERLRGKKPKRNEAMALW